MSEWYYCPKCGEIFDEPGREDRSEYDNDVHAWDYMYEEVCPECGNENFVKAGSCAMCEEPVPPQKILCECCRLDLGRKLNRLIADICGEPDICEVSDEDKYVVLDSLLKVGEEMVEEMA